MPRLKPTPEIFPECLPDVPNCFLAPYQVHFVLHVGGFVQGFSTRAKTCMVGTSLEL